MPDMYRCSMWRFYFKLMNGKLPSYFQCMKPDLPEICNLYDIRKPVFHLPLVKHAFAEHMLKYCLIKLMNNEQASILITAKVHTQQLLIRIHILGLNCILKIQLLIHILKAAL